MVIAVVGTVYSVPVTAALMPQLVAFGATIKEEVAKFLQAIGAAGEIDVAVELVEPATSAAGDRSGAWGVVSPILAAIATGIGVVGFATFIGGAIQYGRFAGAGLPPEEALSVVPSRTLVVLGAKTLTFAVLAGLMGAAVVFIQRAREEGEPEPSGLLQAEANKKRAATLSAVLLTLYALALSEIHVPKFWAVVGLAVGAVLLASAVGAVASRTAGPLWLAAALFISVGLFTGALEVAHAWDNTKVRAAAIVRNDKKAIIGFYIAESGGRIYVGQTPFTPNFNPSQSRIIGVDTAQISDIAIGQPKAPDDARDQAILLANLLCEREIKVVPSASSPQENCWWYPPGTSIDDERQREVREQKRREHKQ